VKKGGRRTEGIRIVTGLDTGWINQREDGEHDAESTQENES
jgi:hypothetical protein